MRRVQYVTFQVEVTARVDAELGKDDCWTVAEVSGIDMDYIEEIAAEVALEKGEWE